MLPEQVQLSLPSVANLHIAHVSSVCTCTLSTLNCNISYQAISQRVHTYRMLEREIRLVLTCTLNSLLHLQLLSPLSSGPTLLGRYTGRYCSQAQHISIIDLVNEIVERDDSQTACTHDIFSLKWGIFYGRYIIIEPKARHHFILLKKHHSVFTCGPAIWATENNVCWHMWL